MNARRARRDVAVLFFVFGVLLTTWISRIPLVKDLLHLSKGQLSLVLVASPLGAFVALQLVPHAVDRWTSRFVARWTVILSCLALVAMGFTPGAFGVAAGLFAFGLLNAAYDMALNTQGVAIERAFGRPILSGLHGVYSVGTLAGALLGTLAASLHVSPKVHFSGVAAVVIVVAFACSRSLFGAEADVPADVDDASGNAEPDHVWRDPALLLLGVVAGCCFLVEGATDNWSGVYLHETLRSSLGAAPLASAAFALGMTAGRFYGDRLIARWGRGRTMSRSAVAAAVGAWLCVLAPSVPLAVAAFALVGFGSGPVVPIAFGLAGNLTRIAPARAIAWVTTIGYVGFVAAPPAVGFIAQATSMRIALALLVPLLLAVAAAGTRFRRVR